MFFSDYYAKIKVDSYDLLAIQKTLTLHNVIIHVKSVPNKDQYHDYNIFLEKCFCQLASKQGQIFFDRIIMLRVGKIKSAKETFYGPKKKRKEKNIHFRY